MMRLFILFSPILESVGGLGDRRDNFCITAGSKYKLVSIRDFERLAKTFGSAIRAMAETKKRDGLESVDEDVQEDTSDKIYSDTSLECDLSS